jgi:hypothetical protein
MGKSDSEENTSSEENKSETSSEEEEKKKLVGFKDKKGTLLWTGNYIMGVEVTPKKTKKYKKIYAHFVNPDTKGFYYY